MFILTSHNRRQYEYNLQRLREPPYWTKVATS